MIGIIPYTGSKQSLLPELLQLFPDKKDYARFVDCFCGGLSVSLNVPKPVLSNDFDKTLISMYEWLKTPDALNEAVSIIEKFSLNEHDAEAYYKFRDHYNLNKTDAGLYVLIMHAFSNMNRTNDDGDFNNTFGQRTLTRSGIERIRHFKTHVAGVSFTSSSFIDLNISSDDFVYCDPPYLITEAVYNKMWNDDLEEQLYNWLDELNRRNIKFGLSNVTTHAGKTNEILLRWMEKYTVHYLDKEYILGQHSDSYIAHTTQEVYVCNYQKETPKKFTLDDIG